MTVWNGLFGTVIFVLFENVVCRECYNFREEPRVRQCSQGCCGEDYQEHCCDATLQIVGCVIGGCVAIGVIIGAAYFCYRTKRKRHPGNGPGILGRLGMRPTQNPHAIAQVSGHPVAVTRRHVPVRLPITRNPQNSQCHYNPAYINSIQMQGNQPPAYYPPSYNAMHVVPSAPTAAMPPPYQMNMVPPPYDLGKSVPPPPEYSAVIGQNVSTGYKYGGYYDNMPPAAD